MLAKKILQSWFCVTSFMDDCTVLIFYLVMINWKGTVSLACQEKLSQKCKAGFLNLIQEGQLKQSLTFDQKNFVKALNKTYKG